MTRPRTPHPVPPSDGPQRLTTAPAPSGASARVDADPARRAQRTAAWSGPLCVAAGMGTFAPEAPGFGTDPARIRTHVEQHLGGLTLSAVCAVVAAAALLALVGALAALIEAHRPGSVASRYVTGVGGLAAAQLVVFTAVYGVWVFVGPVATLDDTTLTTLFAGGAFADSFGSLTLVLSCSMIAVVSCLALRHRFLSRPVAVLGLVVALGELISLGQLLGENPASSTGMYVAIFGWFLWPAVVGADLGLRLMRGGR